MSKLQQAPGELEHVRAFVNTADLEQGAEALATPAQVAEWFASRGLLERDPVATSADFKRALALREALRTVLLAHNGREQPGDDVYAVLDSTAGRADLRLRFERGSGSVLRPGRAGIDGALGRLLAIAHAASTDGTWSRLKACREHSCEWAFYDHTKNRSGTWCNMDVCGNRAKARAYRERRAAAS